MKCPKCETDNPETSRFCADCGTQLGDSGEKPAEPTKLEEAKKPIVHTETMQAPREELTTGSTFARRYQIIEELGKGGMGKVYKTRDTEIKEKIALKLIKPEIAADERTIERFRNEMKLARKIRHKNVCHMFDINKEEDSYYITMEYVDGEDLKSMIRMSGKLSTETVINIGRQICEGLSEAHKLGVVHRDLKPSNVMIDKVGSARIMDFGIARSLKGKGITGAAMMIGTPEYMSPEQVEGGEVDARSDIYSLGIILYEMATGRVPFEGDTPLTIGVKQKTEEPKNPMELNPQIPEELNRLILKCLEKNKDSRYQSIDEIKSELTNALQETTTAERVTSREYPSREVRKRGLPSFLVPGILILIVLVIAGYFILNTLGKKEAEVVESPAVSEWENSIAVLPFRDLSPQKDQEHLCFGMTNEINARLSRINGLKVIATTSMLRYKNTDKDIKDIGNELGVTNILEGNIQKEENRIRVTAQLVNSETAFQVWSNVYDRELKSVFDVQDEISQGIADALKMRLGRDKLDSLKETQPVNTEAYEYAMRGLNIINSRYAITTDEADFDAATRMFKRALEIDPEYSHVYAVLAWSHYHKYSISNDQGDIKLCLEYAERSYRLNPNTMESNLAKGFVHLSLGELDEAFEKYRIAMEINPNSVMGLQTMGFSYFTLGLFEQAIPHYMKGLELDPFYINYKLNLAFCYVNLGNYDQGEAYYKEAMDLNPNHIIVLALYSKMLIEEGRLDEAEELMHRAEEIDPDFPQVVNSRALLHAVRGEKESALALDRSTNVYIHLRMKEEAIKSLQESVEAAPERLRYYQYPDLVNRRLFDSLRDDPRFKKIVEVQKKEHDEMVKKYGKL
jgi:serine/threonine-protein kinase